MCLYIPLEDDLNFKFPRNIQYNYAISNTKLVGDNWNNVSLIKFHIENLLKERALWFCVCLFVGSEKILKMDIFWDGVFFYGLDILWDGFGYSFFFLFCLMVFAYASMNAHIISRCSTTGIFDLGSSYPHFKAFLCKTYRMQRCVDFYITILQSTGILYIRSSCELLC